MKSARFTAVSSGLKESGILVKQVFASCADKEPTPIHTTNKKTTNFFTMSFHYFANINSLFPDTRFTNKSTTHAKNTHPHHQSHSNFHSPHPTRPILPHLSEEAEPQSPNATKSYTQYAPEKHPHPVQPMFQLFPMLFRIRPVLSLSAYKPPDLEKEQVPTPHLLPDKILPRRNRKSPSALLQR